MSAARAWPNVEEMRRGIALMRQGCPYFAWQLPDGSYRPCRQIGQLTQFEAGIFDGTHTPGFYAIRPGNLTRWCALDFDNHDGSKSRKYWLSDAQRAFDCLAAQLAERWLVETSPGGYHVIGFADALLPAADVRRILWEIAPTGVEVFPKQDVLDTTKPNAKGSLLRFPGRHQLKGTWALFIACSGRVRDVEGIAAASNPAPAQFLSLYAQVTRGLQLTGTGQRFNAMQIIVGRLKGRTLDEAIAVDIHDRFYNQHRARIQTPIEQSRAYFLTWFRKAAPCNVEIPDCEPTPAQAAMVAGLPKLPDIRPELLIVTVRLFLSAKKHADAQGREFFLSLPTIARRLGVSIASASNYRNACYRVGLIEMVKRGSYVSGKASTYRLKPEWQR